MQDASGEFYAELEVSPEEIFGGLMIEGSWTDISARLAGIAAGES